VPELLIPPEKHTFIAYGVWLYRETNQQVRRLKKEVSPSVHGDRHWSSSYVLMDYFTAKPLKKKSRVLDVGCGWGPTAIFLAKKGCAVTGLDIDLDVFAFLQAQAELNSVKVAVRQGAMASLKRADLADYDIIVGGDICFWDELTDEWLGLLKRASKAGVKKVVLADPGRSPFFALVDKCIERWPVEVLNWYALEPKRFKGTLLVVDLSESA
jgi:predicted nicotinamide N-methyase